MATQTLTFLSADIEGSAAMCRRPREAYAGVLAGYRRLVRARLVRPGWAEHVG